MMVLSSGGFSESHDRMRICEDLLGGVNLWRWERKEVGRRDLPQ